MDIYLKLFEVLFPVFFIVGIGYFLGKKNPKLDTSFITNFAANIGTPAMVFYSITTTGITFEIFTNYFWYALLAISGFALTGIVFYLFLKKKLLENYLLLFYLIQEIWVYQFAYLRMAVRV